MSDSQDSQRLIVVPCGRSKIWDRNPEQGPTFAKDAYTGVPFKINREYAEHFADHWVILSARYGFISPDWPIPGPYEVTFKKKSTGPIEVEQLRIQVRDQELDRFSTVIGLGGREYRDALTGTFAGSDCEVTFPFSGLSIGIAMQRTKLAISTNQVCPIIGNSRP